MHRASSFRLLGESKQLSDCGAPQAPTAQVVNFKLFRPALETPLVYGDGVKGDRPSYDPVAMFKALILAGQNTVSDARIGSRSAIA